MKRHVLVFGGFLLALIFVVLYPRFEPVQAQDNGPYVPSGILVSDLGKHTPPGRLNVRFPPRDPAQVGEDIRQQLLQSQRVAPLAAEAVPTITAEIQTLAAGLENNPLAIYDYVRNHIDYVPSWGLLKNPRETLLAGAGNAFDQAALLSALLNAAGFQTRYVWGTIEISKTAAMNWVGAADPSAVGYVFANGGIPTADTGSALQTLSHLGRGVGSKRLASPGPQFQILSRACRSRPALRNGLQSRDFSGRCPERRHCYAHLHTASQPSQHPNRSG